MDLYLKRKFDAAHFLPGYEGKCANMHGHTWVVEVWVSGKVDPVTGMVCDFGDLKAPIDALDHTLLNDTLENPTAENLAKHLRLAYLPLMATVRVWESENAYAEDDGLEVYVKEIEDA